MDMTPQEYQGYVARKQAKSPIVQDTLRAFLSGGCICLLGQLMTEWMLGPLKMDKETASAWTSVSLVLLSAILTGCNIYPRLVKFGGAGALVPITGFANSVAAPAIEYQAEGDVFGVGCKIFTIAGPVILYGVFASWVLGILYWTGRLAGVFY